MFGFVVIFAAVHVVLGWEITSFGSNRRRRCCYYILGVGGIGMVKFVKSSLGQDKSHQLFNLLSNPRKVPLKKCTKILQHALVPFCTKQICGVLDKTLFIVHTATKHGCFFTSLKTAIFIINCMVLAEKLRP